MIASSNQLKENLKQNKLHYFEPNVSSKDRITLRKLFRAASF